MKGVNRETLYVSAIVVLLALSSFLMVHYVSNEGASIHVYLLDMTIYEDTLPIYGPHCKEVNGTYIVDNEGWLYISGEFPCRNVIGLPARFNITISPYGFNTSPFMADIHMTNGNGIWFSNGWLVVIESNS